MDVKQFLTMGASVLTLSLCGPVLADETQGPYVRIAELEVDPPQLEGFKAATKEVGETSVRVEPGCVSSSMRCPKKRIPAASSF